MTRRWARLATPVAAIGCTVALLSACTTKGSDEPSGDNTAASANTGAAPTASDNGSASTPAGGDIKVKDAGKIKVALVPGGAHPYFQPWKKGAEAASKEFKLGGWTFNETGQWDQAKQNAAIQSLTAQGYNAFGIFGVSPTAINSTFDRLKKQKLAVGSVASCPAGNQNKADYCLSTDVYQAAYKAAKTAITAMNGKGNLVHLTGNNVDSNTQRRIAGVKKAIDETKGQVKLFQTITDIDTDLQTAQKSVTDLLNAKGRQIQGIVTTAYNPAVAAADGVTKAKLPIKVVAIDDDAKILNGIKAGQVYATVAQNPEGQGYLSTWMLALLGSKQCTMKNPGVIVDSGSFVVTKKNVSTYDNERKAKTKQLKSMFSAQQLTCN